MSTWCDCFHHHVIARSTSNISHHVISKWNVGMKQATGQAMASTKGLSPKRCDKTEALFFLILRSKFGLDTFGETTLNQA